MAQYLSSLELTFLTFKVLPNGLMNLHTEALKRDNITKNRFKKIYPCTYSKNKRGFYIFCSLYLMLVISTSFIFILDDANRVILMSSGGSYSGDYINASYIQVT